MPLYLLLLVFFVLSCESSKRYVYYDRYERDNDYRAIISRIRDVEVNRNFEVRATLEDRRGRDLRDTTEVEVHLSGGNRNADLRGNTERDARRGRVTFPNLRIDRTGRNYRIVLSFEVDGEDYEDRSNRFDVYGDNDDGNGIRVGGSLFSVDLQGLPDNIVAGRALPDLTFKSKVLGNKSTGGTIRLKVKDSRGQTRDDAMMVWRKPTASAAIKSGQAVFREVFFTQALDTGAELVAEAVRYVGTERFTLPRVHDSTVELDAERIEIVPNATELHGIVRINGSLCTDCAISAYLISKDKVRDASTTNTDSRGAFTANIDAWQCVAGASYRGAVRVTRTSYNYYAMIQADCG